MANIIQYDQQGVITTRHVSASRKQYEGQPRTLFYSKIEWDALPPEPWIVDLTSAPTVRSMTQQENDDKEAARKQDIKDADEAGELFSNEQLAFTALYRALKNGNAAQQTLATQWRNRYNNLIDSDG